MPRKTEIQAEETAAASPLRRSSRTAPGGAGTPSSVKTRRTSLLSQDSEKKDNEEERIESKPATRTRRGKYFTLVNSFHLYTTSNRLFLKLHNFHNIVSKLMSTMLHIQSKYTYKQS